MKAKEQVYEYLREQGIAFEVAEHSAVFTIEEMDALNFGAENSSVVVKNLFLRDAKGKRHFLVVLQKDKQANLSALQQELGCTKLSFASEDRLQRLLGLTKGSVSPLGVLSDADQQVELAIDRDLIEQGRVGVHPNDNTATVFLSFEDLKQLIIRRGNPIHFIKI